MDLRVAQMLQNQQRYMQMCSSSAQIFQMLSRLVPGVAISGQVMEIESVSENSEESSPTSESASPAQSPAVASDDNSGCVIWAEPFMTCQLTPSWKPYCEDVRRLPPGVRPEDLRNQNCPGTGCPSDSGALSGSDGNKCSGNCSDGLPQRSTADVGAAFKDMSTQTVVEEKSSDLPNSGNYVLEDTGVTDFGTTHSAFNDAMLKISSAAKTIRHARNILAALNSRGQVNNNNNPEVSCAGGSSEEKDANGSENSNSGRNESESKNDGHTTITEVMSENGGGGEHVTDASETNSSNISQENCPHMNFPAPILVKSACEPIAKKQAESGKHEVFAAGNGVVELSASSAVEGQSSITTDSGVSVLRDQGSYTAELSTPPLATRKPAAPGRHLQICRPMMGPRTSLSEYQAARMARYPRIYGNLYRQPANTAAPDTNNRTQQSASLSSKHLENTAQPPTLNNPAVAPGMPTAGGKLTIDFATLNVTDSHRPKRMHKITLDHFKTSLEAAISNLKKLNAWMVSEKSGTTDSSSGIGTSVSAFTLTEVEKFANSPDHPGRDCFNRDTVLNDVIRQVTNTADVNAGGDGARNIVSLSTEVESIFYSQRRAVSRPSTGVQSDKDSREVSNTGRGKKSPDTPADAVSCGASAVDKHENPVNNDTRPRGSLPVSRNSSSHAPRGTPCPDGQVSSSFHNASNRDGSELTKNDSTVDAGASERLLRKDSWVENSAHPSQQITESQNKETAVKSLVIDASMARTNTGNTFGNPMLTFLACALAGKPNEDHHFVQETHGTDGRSKVVEGTNSEVNIHHDITSSDGSCGSPVNFSEEENKVKNLAASDDTLRSPCSADGSDEYARKNGIRENFQHLASENDAGQDIIQVFNVETAVTSSENVYYDLHRTPTSESASTEFSGKSDHDSVNDEDTASLEIAEGSQVFNHDPKETEKYEETTSKERQGSTERALERDVAGDWNTSVIELEDDGDHTLKSTMKTSSRDLDDNQFNAQPCRIDINHKLHDSITSDPDESVNQQSILKRSPEDQAVDDASETSVTVKSISVDSSPTMNSRRLDKRSFGRRFRRRSRSRGTRVEHLNDCKDPGVHTKKVREKLTDSASLSKSDHPSYIDSLPGFLPDENDAVHTTISGTFLKLSSGSHVSEKAPFPTPQLSVIKTTPSVMFENELEKMVEDNAKPAVKSAVAGNGSSNVSSSSIDTVVIADDRGLIPNSASSSAERGTAVVDHDERVEVEQPRSDGFRARLRRFFAQCLRPFSHRN